MTYYLIADLAFECTDPGHDTDEAFDQFTDLIQDELNNLAEFDHGIIDPDMTTMITDRQASFLIGIEAGALEDAVRLFSINLRCALHAAGAGTPDWPMYKPTEATPDVRKADFAEA